MKRLLLAGVVALLPAAGVASASAPSRASLTGFQCPQASEPTGRGIQTIAVMRPLSGTKAMQLRFELLTKPRSSGGYTVVPGGDLGRWISPSNPTLGQRSGDKWVFKKQVVDLAAPASYRFRVDFRWMGAHSRVLGTATRYSRVCLQTAPDLLVKSIAVRAVSGKPNLNRYIAVVGNAGNAGAGPFVVQFTDTPASPKTRTVTFLRPRDTVRESFVGPKCTSGAATVTVDPGDQTDDYNRANNAMTAVC
jgi:hypothetical protein